ncbi:MAG: PBSX family phage terminase large subunit [Alphaproteobacteria bacterium]|nr:PBSX family phage terminase large subunit [Alphaproteobacteria bacterium]
MRYKVLMGGRGSGKSWAVADALLVLGLSSRKRVLCAREFQASIKDSVHKLLSDRIEALSLGAFYAITETAIRGLNGTEFIFKGLRHNITEVKSTEGIDICWVEEGQAVSEKSWTVLTPTIRAPGSEIWIVFNPDSPEDATYKRFVTNKPDNCILIEASYLDNKYFKDTELESERAHDEKFNQDIYEWKWLGKPRVYSDAQIMHGKFELSDFKTPESVSRWFYGMDFGYATDPNVLVRSFIRDNCLYIADEWFGHHVDLEDMPKYMDAIPDARRWPIKADGARPETIAFLRRKGYDVSAAKKWAGSVEDGIAYLRSFNRIYIHIRCKHIYDEFRLYSYKVDANNGDVLPIIIDKHNHGIDALRYSLDGYIRAKGEQAAPEVSARALGL